MCCAFIVDLSGCDIHCGGHHVPSAGQYPTVSESSTTPTGGRNRQHDRCSGQLDPHHGAWKGLRKAGPETDTMGFVYWYI